MLTLTNCVLTAYIATSHPCSNGNYPRTSITVAAPRSIPLGTRVYIEGIGYRTVEDRTARKYDGRWDLFVGSEEEAKKWGKRRVNITIYETQNNFH